MKITLERLSDISKIYQGTIIIQWDVFSVSKFLVWIKHVIWFPLLPLGLGLVGGSINRASW